MTFHSIIASRLLNYTFLIYILGICRDVWPFSGTSTHGVWADYVDLTSVPLFPNLFLNETSDSVITEDHHIVAITLDLNEPTGFEVNVTNKNGLSYKEVCSPRFDSEKNGGDRLITSVYMGNQLVWSADLGEYCKCVTVTSYAGSPGLDNGNVYEVSSWKQRADLNNNNNLYTPDMINYDVSARRYKASDDGVPRVSIELIFIEVLSSLSYNIRYFYSLTPFGGSTDTNKNYGPTIREVDQRRYNLFLYKMSTSPYFDPEYVEQVDYELANEHANLIDGVDRKSNGDAHFGHPEGEGNIDINYTLEPTHNLDRFTKLKYIANANEYSVEEVYYSRSDPTIVLESVERVRNKKADPEEPQVEWESVDNLPPLLSFKIASQNIGDNTPGSGNEDHMIRHLAFTPKTIHQKPVTGLSVIDIIKPELNPNVDYDYEVSDGIPILSIKAKISKFIKPIIAVYESTNHVWYDPDSRMTELRAFSSYGEYKLIELIYQTKEVSGKMGSNEGGLYDELQAGNIGYSQSLKEIMESSENSENSGEDNQLHYGESYITYFKKINNKWEEVKIKEYEKGFKDMRKKIRIVDMVSLDVSVVDNTNLFFQKGETSNQFQAITYFPLTGYRLNSVMDGSVVIWRSKKKRCVAVVVVRDLPSSGVSISVGNELIWESASKGAGEIRFLKLELAGGIGSNGMRIKNRYYKKVQVSMGRSEDTTNRMAEGNNVDNDGISGATDTSFTGIDNEGSELNDSSKPKYRYLRITESEFERSINGQLDMNFNIHITAGGNSKSKVESGATNTVEDKLGDGGKMNVDGYDISDTSGIGTDEYNVDKISGLDDPEVLEGALEKIRLFEGPGKIDDTSTQCDTATTSTGSRIAIRQRLPGEITSGDRDIMEAVEGMSLDSSFTVGMGEDIPEYEGDKLDLEALGDNEDDRVSMKSVDKVEKWLNRNVNEFDIKGKHAQDLNSEGNESTGEEIDQLGEMEYTGDPEVDDVPNGQEEDYEYRVDDLDIVYSRSYKTDEYNGIIYRTFTPPKERVFKGIRVYGSYLWRAGEKEHTDFVRVFYPEGRPEMGLFRLVEEDKSETKDIYFIRDADGWKFVTSEAMMKQFRSYVIENHETRSL